MVHQELTQGCSSVIFQKQTSKQTHRKREEIKFVVTRAEGRGRRIGRQSKDYKLPVTGKINTRDIRYNIILYYVQYV